MKLWTNLKNSISLESGYDELQKEIFNEFDARAYRLGRLISALPNFIFFLLIFKWPLASAIGFFTTYIIQAFFQLRLERQKIRRLRQLQLDKVYIEDVEYHATLRKWKMGATIFGASISAPFTPVMILTYSLLRGQSFLASLFSA